MDDNQEDNDGEERNSQSSIKQPRLKEGIQNQVKGKRRSAEFTATIWMRTWKYEMMLKLAEMKVKAKVVIKNGITDEDRAHQLKMQELKLKHDVEKE